MSVLDALRSRGSRSRRTGDRDAPTRSFIDDHKGMDDKAVVADLSLRSQEELAEIERHERANGARAAVLNKLRYLRGKEPFRGYDALDADGVVAALRDADHATLLRVRGYERKFRGRQQVLDEVKALRGRRAAEKDPAG